MSQIPPQPPQDPQPLPPESPQQYPPPYAYQQYPPPKPGMSAGMIALIITGVGVVVLGFLLLLVIAILLPSLNRARETAYRSNCSNNMKQIGLAMLMYANDNQQRFPRTCSDDEGNMESSVIRVNQSNAGVDDKNPFENPASAIATTGSEVPYNCVPASLFWLLRTQDLSPEVFNCPSSNTTRETFGQDRTPANTAVDRGNWTNIQNNLSYSMTCPFNGGKDLAKLFKWNTTLHADFPLLADINPGGPGVLVDSRANGQAMRGANSMNHNQDGQNVLYADGHVEWQMSPLCGRMINGRRDNIYCRSGVDTYDGISNPEIDSAHPYGGPANADDAVMLPTFQ